MLSSRIAHSESINGSYFTRVDAGDEITVAADYSGLNSIERKWILSFLIISNASVFQWESDRQKVRDAFLMDGRRMSYKSLGDSRRKRALVPFLKAADSLHGNLVTFVLPQTTKESILGDFYDSIRFPELIVSQHTWSNDVFIKLSLVATFGSLLIGALSDPTQNILFLTDQDEIAQNDTQINHAGHVICRHLAFYAPRHFGAFTFATTEIRGPNQRWEDLASLPDLACGAITKVVELQRKSNVAQSSRIIRPIIETVNHKSGTILSWLVLCDS